MDIDKEIQELIKQECSRTGQRSGLDFMLMEERYNGCYYELRYDI